MYKKLFLSGGLSLVSVFLMASQSIADTSVSDLIAETDSDHMGQVTSVDQLSDVDRSHWAYTAVKNLVDNGCIEGDRNTGLFRGDDPISRYEMAALLNSCLPNINSSGDGADQATINALRNEFSAELRTLEERVGELDARLTTVEGQQFSTTTKLEGSVIITGQFGDQVDVANNDSRASVISEVGLSFNTSFNGEDLLQITLLTGNGGDGFFGNFFDNSPNVFPTPVNPGVIEYRDTGPGVELDRLAYEFSPVENLSVTVGPQLYPSDFIDANSYANDPGVDFNSGFFINNALIINDAIDDPGGAGFGFVYNVGGGPISLRAGYVAAEGASPVEGATTSGLFGDPHQAVAEIEFAKKNMALRLQYAYVETFESVQNVLGVNAEITFGKFGLFGRYGIALDPQQSGVDLFANDNNIQTWMAGVGLSDLIIPGSSLSFAAGQPYIAPGTPATQTNFEGFYRIPVSDNITLTPAVMVITDPVNQDDNTLIQGVIRASFSF